MKLTSGMANTRTDHSLPPPEVSRDIARVRLRDLSLSRRTLNALTNAGLVTVGDLLHLSAVEITRIPNLGAKSCSEIERSLRALEVSLRSTPLTAAAAAQRCEHTANDPRYSLRLMEISPAAMRRLEASGIRCTCQLVEVNHAELLRAMDFNTVLTGAVAAEIRRNSEGRLRRRYHDTVPAAAPGDEPQTLDAELWSLTAPLVDPERRRLAMAVYGWDGSPRHTLPEIAAEFGIDSGTAAGVCARVEARWKTETARVPRLTECLRLMASQAPVLAAKLEEQLVQQGLSRILLRVEGLLSAAAIAGLEAPFCVLGNETRLVIPKGRENDFNAVVQVVRRIERSRTTLTPEEISIVASQAVEHTIPVEFVRRSLAVVESRDGASFRTT